GGHPRPGLRRRLSRRLRQPARGAGGAGLPRAAGRAEHVRVAGTGGQAQRGRRGPDLQCPTSTQHGELPPRGEGPTPTGTTRIAPGRRLGPGAGGGNGTIRPVRRPSAAAPQRDLRLAVAASAGASATTAAVPVASGLALGAGVAALLLLGRLLG